MAAKYVTTPTRYTKRRVTKKSSTVRLRKATALHHSNKLLTALAREGHAAQLGRAARYAKKDKIGRRRRGEKKDFARAIDSYKSFGTNVFAWLTANPAKRRRR